MQTTITISLPDWIKKYVQQAPKQFDTIEKKMKFVLGLAKENIVNKTGGPFAAAIFNMDTNQLVSSAVNRIQPEHSSFAHGETMAILFAQKHLKTHNFSLIGKFQMVTSAKMCVMCLGNVRWSGLSQVVYSANINDTQEITGWDQGPLPANYDEQLIKRGINVVGDVLNEQGRQILKLYVKLNPQSSF